MRAKCAKHSSRARSARTKSIGLEVGTHHEVLHDGFTTNRGCRSSNGKLEGGAKAKQEIRRTQGLGGRACLTQQPPPVTGFVKEELHSACVPRTLRGRGHT